METQNPFVQWWMAMVGAALCCAVGAGAAHAAVLYTSAPDYTQNSYQSTSASSAEQECTLLSLDATSSVTQVSFWGDYYDSTLVTDNFTISLYTYSTTPSTTALVTQTAASPTRVDTGMTSGRGRETYLYTATLPSPLLLTGGTNYTIAILNSASTWNWQLGASGTNYYRVGADGTAWTQSGIALQDSIQLVGTVVPEPSSVVLLGIAAVSAGAVWRRRRV